MRYEESLRNVLRRARPRDAVLGEEFGRTGSGPRCWVIDPIDATMNYVRGVPVWATLIGLMDGDEVVVGVVSAPALGRRWWAARDGGAWTGRSLTKATRCRVSSVAKMPDASLSYSSLSDWEAQGRLGGLLDLGRAVWRTRAYGDFWSHMLVAEGAVDVCAEPEVSLWDLAALHGDRRGGRWQVHRPVRQAHTRRRQRGIQQRPAARRGARPAQRRSPLARGECPGSGAGRRAGSPPAGLALRAGITHAVGSVTKAQALGPWRRGQGPGIAHDGTLGE